MATFGFDSDSEEDNNNNNNNITNTDASNTNEGEAKIQDSIPHNPKPQSNELKQKSHRYYSTIQPLPLSKYQWKDPPKIHSIVGSAKVFSKSEKEPCTINLKAVASTLNNTIFDPAFKQVAALVQLRNPELMIKIFPNGTLTVIGAKTIQTLYIGLRKIAYKLKYKCGYNNIVSLRDINISSISAKAEIGYKLNLNKIEDKYNKYCTYDDERRHYIKFFRKEKDGKGGALVYRNGQIALMGIKSIDIVVSWFDELYEYVSPFRDDNNNVNDNDNDNDNVDDNVNENDDENDIDIVDNKNIYIQNNEYNEYNNENDEIYSKSNKIPRIDYDYNYNYNYNHSYYSQPPLLLPQSQPQPQPQSQPPQLQSQIIYNNNDNNNIQQYQLPPLQQQQQQVSQYSQTYYYQQQYQQQYPPQQQYQQQQQQQQQQPSSYSCSILPSTNPLY